MAHNVVYLILAFFVSYRTVWATRYLPTIIWDHLNPLLYCKCNWLVIPTVDQYDQQQFTCPTADIYANLLDGYFRTDNQRNENIFRRRWPGTKDDLMNRIRSGNIDSFCDSTSPETTELQPCKNGLYKSTEVRYKLSSKQGENYNQDNIYVFFNNGDNGTSAALKSKKAICTMFFAVYVTTSKKIVHGMNFGKPALTSSHNCKLSMCPLASPSPSPSSLPTSTSAVSSRFGPVHKSSTEQLSTSPLSSTIQGNTVTSSTQYQQISSTQHKQFSSITPSATPKLSGPRPSVILLTKTMVSRSVTQKPATKKPSNTLSCSETWLNNTIFIVLVIVAFFAGVCCTIFAVAVWRALSNKAAPPTVESLTLENTYRYRRDGETIGSPTECVSPVYGTPQTEIRNQQHKESILSRNL